MDLRQYQIDLLRQVERALSPQNARVMMQLPTGGGKTIIAGHLLKGYLASGRKAVWLTHRKELAGQTRMMLRETCGVNARYVENPRRVRFQGPLPSLGNGVVILMAQTVGRRARNSNVWNRYNRYTDNDLMIIDEAHHSTADGYERAMKRWRGRVLGMTATPWRLSEREGFDHLFDNLICGAQVSELQSGGSLCEARVLTPSPEARVRGGEIGRIGDYTDAGIERANEGRNIMTAGALEFWREHASDRQTIVYAVSVGHAQNLTQVFNDAGIPAGLMLGETPSSERAATIERFRAGALKVLVNVAVATEGFDLPDASCVVIARPTKSLALYLQMVGRGLRPKPDGGDCLILDLAGNSLRHGLPEERREWSLAPRGAPPEGEAPAVRCDVCGTVSPAASHDCRHCGEPFGKDCSRCGKWRSWNRWSMEEACGYTHDAVCDLCHRDAHVEAHLPVTDEMERLASEGDGEDVREATPEHNYIDERLRPLLRELLEEERDRALARNRAKQTELRDSIEKEDRDLQNNETLDRQFEDYLAALPPERSPRNRPEESRMFVEYERGRRRALAASRNELAELGTHTVDMSETFERFQASFMRVLQSELEGMNPSYDVTESPLVRRRARQSGLGDTDPLYDVSETNPNESSAIGWIPITELINNRIRPVSIKFPSEEGIRIKSWIDLLIEIAEWLIRENRITDHDCPIILYGGSCLINNIPRHPDGRKFRQSKELSNGLHLFSQLSSQRVLQFSKSLLGTYYSQYLSPIRVQLPHSP